MVPQLKKGVIPPQITEFVMKARVEEDGFEDIHINLSVQVGQQDIMRDDLLDIVKKHEANCLRDLKASILKYPLKSTINDDIFQNVDTSTLTVTDDETCNIASVESDHEP